MTTLTIIRGLPGAGKSTLAQKLVDGNPNAVHLEADMYFIDLDGVYTYQSQKIGFAHKWCQQSVQANLALGKDVIVSNTFTRYFEMEPYFDMCAQLGIIPQIVICQGQFGSIHDVPDDVMVKMSNRFQYDLGYISYAP